MGNNKEKWNILRALELTQEKETDEEVICWLGANIKSST
jgi:hypothetical protein